MIPPKNFLIGLLALTTLAGGALAWREHQQLVALRAATLGPDERAEWEQRVRAAEKQRAELESTVAARQEKTAEAEPADSAEAVSAPPPTRPETVPGPRENFASALEHPEVQRLMAIQHKASLDQRYADLFKTLNLSPQQLEQFKNLLVEKNTAVTDVMAAARAEGVSPRTNRDAFRELVKNAQNEIDESIRNTIGEAGYSQYKQYEQTMPQRRVVNQLEQRLSYTPTPLTAPQAEQMVQILSTTAAPNSNRRGGTPVAVTETTVNQALGVLAGPQLDALRQIQQEQQAQAALSAAIRAQTQNNRRRNAAPVVGGSTPPPPAPPAGG